MRKKTVIYLIFMVFILGISACSKENFAEPEQTAEVTEQPEKTSTNAPEEQEETTEEPVIERTAIAKSEAYGYEMEYNQDMFAYYNSEGIDNYTPVDVSIEQEGTIFVAVQRLKGSNGNEVAESFRAASNSEVKDVKVGAKSYKAKYVYVSNEIDGTVQFVKRYVVQHKKDVFLIEVSGYEGMDEKALEAMEKMVGSFQIG